MPFMYVGIVSILVSLLCWFLNKIQSFFMVLKGFSSSSSSCFPEGLRVLVVDNDPETLKNLDKLLKKCKYEVTTSNSMHEALKLLRERKDEFDIVISECNMPGMDGFEFLQHVIVQMDIPVIIMSSVGDTIRVKNVVEWGACDYLVKPIRLKELRNIWQHVLRKRIRRMRDIKHPVEIQTMKTEPDQPDMFLGKKRKEVEDKDHDRECGDHLSVKKPRVIWSADLHLKFVQAVKEIGLDKAGPKKILELMAVPWLKRENVASHLQKYRLNLSRAKKEEEVKAASDWVKHSDMFSKGGYFQPSTNQNIVKAENFVPGALHIHNAKILTKPTAIEANNAVIDTPINTPSGISINQSFGPLDSEVNSQQVSRNPFTWTAHVPLAQFQQLQLKPHYGIGQVTDVENTAALFSDQLQSHLAFDTISNSMWTPVNHSLDQNPHYNLPNSDGFSSFGDFYAQNQEPVDYESFNDALQRHLSTAAENPVRDPPHPQ